MRFQLESKPKQQIAQYQNEANKPKWPQFRYSGTNFAQF